LGIDVKRSIAISWALAALLSTMAAIYWLSSGVITLGVSEIGLISLPCVLLAGLESIPGALLAGLVVGIGQSIAGGYLDPFARGGVSLVFPFLIMLAILLVRPQGFFGWKRIERL
jgi:branched-chain amino acid transport system permease protein